MGKKLLHTSHASTPMYKTTPIS